MDIYHVWCDLKPEIADTEFADRVAAYLEHLRAEGLIQSWRLTRRKLGLGVSALGEFHIMIDVTGLAQLDSAFARVASRAGLTESLHFQVNSLVRNAQFALYRDFPDPVRRRGEEKF